tara:strand:+ start:335 stop:529 length:195 start_codon:yes stop_codon:yes gene_type:complete
MLPEIWQGVARINPFLYMINGLRYGFYGISDVSINFSIGFILVLAIVLFLVCFNIFRTGWNLKT